MEKSTHSPEYDLLRRELLRYRTQANLSQRALAARLRVSPSWVAKVETGERRLDLIELCWLLQACELDPPAAMEQLTREVTTLRAKKRGRGK